MIYSNYKSDYFKENILVKRFLDKEILVKVKKIGLNNIIFFKFKKKINESILTLIMLLHILKKKKIKNTLFIPYLPYSRQNKFIYGKCCSLYLICDILNFFKIKKLFTIDLHTKYFYKKFRKVFTNINAFEVIKKIIVKRKIKTIIFPDLGSYKRNKKIKKLCNNIIKFKKERKKYKIKIKNKGIVKKIKKKVLIIDDIINTGNTIKKIIKILRKNYKKKIYLYVTHTLLKMEEFSKYLKKKNIFLYTTDSFCKIYKNKNIKIYNHIDFFKEKIIKYDKSFFKKKKRK